MREIKFRAWDSNKKQMFPVAVLALLPCSWSCPDYGYRGVSLPYQPSLKVMQFIGASDMSEQPQELYEDDVVEITIFNPFQPGKIIVQKRRKIEFEDGVFGVRWNHILMPFCQFAANTRIIKIGNIWENANLLEADSK